MNVRADGMPFANSTAGFAIVLGLMRSNVWLTGGSMLAGKALRYIVVLATFEGAASLF